MYWKAPKPEELSPFGFTVADVTPPAVEPWPDNELICRVFRRLETQWMTGASGRPTGLNYASLPIVMRRCGVPRNEFGEVFDGLQVMETAALEEMYKG